MVLCDGVQTLKPLHLTLELPMGPVASVSSKLKDIAIDADVYLDVGGGSLRYRVVEISVVMPNDIHVLAPTEIPSITLVTCYPFYFLGDAPQRYIVRAELADAQPATSEEARAIPDVQLHPNVIRSLSWPFALH